MHPFEARYSPDSAPNTNPLANIHEQSRRPSVPHTSSVPQNLEQTRHPSVQSQNRRPSLSNLEQTRPPIAQSNVERTRRPSTNTPPEPIPTTDPSDVESTFQLSVQQYGDNSGYPSLNSDAYHHNHRRQQRHYHNDFRNFLSYFNPYNFYSSSRHSRHLHQHQQQQQQQQQTRDKPTQSLMTPNGDASSNDKDNATPLTIKSSIFPKFVIVGLFLFSFVSLCISSYLMYKYQEGPNCTAFSAQENSMAVTGNFSPLLGRKPGHPSAHVLLVKGGDTACDPKKLTMLKLSRKKKTTVHHTDVDLGDYGLTIERNGTYYIYFSINTVISDSSHKNQPFLAELRYSSNNQPGRTLSRAHHTWCKDCPSERTTVFNAGVFQLKYKGNIYVRVNCPMDVGDETYLGLFLV